MDAPLSLEKEIPSNHFIAIPCGECHRETRHAVLSCIKTHWQDEYGAVDLWKFHEVVQCQGCLTISFCEASKFSEDWEIDKVTGEQYIPTTRKFYPSRSAGRPQMNSAQLLPKGVYKIYDEAHTAFCSELPIMAGFGLRSILEAVCQERNMEGRDLAQRIDALVAADLITLAGANILHGLRFMGNAAAHEMRDHSPDELSAGFNVVEYLLHGVYFLPRQAEGLPGRKPETDPKNEANK